jgi:hypothetical protein
MAADLPSNLRQGGRMSIEQRSKEQIAREAGGLLDQGYH